MSSEPPRLNGARILVAGGSSGIGRAFAVAAHDQGARVAVAARRVPLLAELAEMIDGHAYELDITDITSIRNVVASAVQDFGEIDVLLCSSGVLPFARVEHIDASTWTEAFAVNAIGPALLISTVLPHLAADAVILLVTSDEQRRSRTGTAAYGASKVAFDEIVRSWRWEHPNLRFIRVAMGAVAGTEILRGADRELLAELMVEWEQQGQVPHELGDVADIAAALVGIVARAVDNPTLLTENVRIVTKNVPSRLVDAAHTGVPGAS